MENYYNKQFKDDKKKLSLLKAESILPVFPELTRDLQLFELSSLEKIKGRNL